MSLELMLVRRKNKTVPNQIPSWKPAAVVCKSICPWLDQRSAGAPVYRHENMTVTVICRKHHRIPTGYDRQADSIGFLLTFSSFFFQKN